MFTMCLGKNGGYIQIGGHDATGRLVDDITWIPLHVGEDFKTNMVGMKINNHFIKDSEKFKLGFIDSGTTFTYFPKQLFSMIRLHFNVFCNSDPENNCAGVRNDNGSAGLLCFAYDEKAYPEGPKKYFMTYPILRFLVDTGPSSEPYELDWYPSEYLYRENTSQYCLAADVHSQQEIMIGGTLMRQH